MFGGIDADRESVHGFARPRKLVELRHQLRHLDDHSSALALERREVGLTGREVAERGRFAQVAVVADCIAPVQQELDIGPSRSSDAAAPGLGRPSGQRPSRFLYPCVVRS